MKIKHVSEFVLSEITKATKQRIREFCIDVPPGCGRQSIAIELIKQKHFKKQKGNVLPVKHRTLVIADRHDLIEEIKLAIYESGLDSKLVADSYDGSSMDNCQVFFATPKTVFRFLDEGAASGFKYLQTDTVIVFDPSKSELQKYYPILNSFANAFYFATNKSLAPFDKKVALIRVELEEIVLPFKMSDYKTVIGKVMLTREVFIELKSYWTLLPDGFYKRKFGRTKQQHLQLLNSLDTDAAHAMVENENIKSSAGNVLRYIESENQKFQDNLQVIRAFRRETKKLNDSIIAEYEQ